MRMVYTNESRILVGNARNLIGSKGIDTCFKNEYAQGAIGEASAFDSWLELWVIDDSNYERAFQIIETSLSKDNAPAWVCKTCSEENDTSFEVCWCCQSENS